MRPERPLGAPPGFGGVGGNHPDVHLGHGAAELGGVVLVDLPTRFGGVPVVGSPVGVEGAEQPFGSDDLSDSLETAHCAFLIDEEHQVMLAGDVVHGDDEVPPLPRDPAQSAAATMPRAASIVSATGFSTSMGTPRSAQAIAAGT